MIKTLVIIVCIFVVPGVVMGLISSYRAGQKPHRDLIDHIRKLHNRK